MSKHKKVRLSPSDAEKDLRNARTRCVELGMLVLERDEQIKKLESQRDELIRGFNRATDVIRTAKQVLDL